MLPRAHRLRSSTGFQRAIRKGVTRGRPTVVVHAFDTGTDEPSQIGFVVGRRVGGAVVRNRVRRRLRHLVAARVGQLGQGKVVVVRATSTAGCSPALGDDLAVAWQAAVGALEERAAAVGAVESVAA